MHFETSFISFVESSNELVPSFSPCISCKDKREPGKDFVRNYTRLHQISITEIVFRSNIRVQEHLATAKISSRKPASISLSMYYNANSAVRSNSEKYSMNLGSVSCITDLTDLRSLEFIIYLIQFEHL
jgi:hypothetical protein